MEPDTIRIMAQLITNELIKLPNAVANTKPAMALGIIAFKGQQASDDVYLSGGAFPGIAAYSVASGRISGTTTDHAPALAGYVGVGSSMLYLAWKVAGQETVEVRQYLLDQDGSPAENSQWVSLPTASGRPSNPVVSTDGAPAMAVGANNQLYIAWKAPGDAAAMSWSVYDGSGWSDPETIPSATTSVAPALAGFDSSGPGNVWPLCLTYSEAASNAVTWAMFTPGAATLTRNAVSGATTETTPAVTNGPGFTSSAGPAFVIVWKPVGEASLSFVSVQGETASQIYTLPQAETNLGPGAFDAYDVASGNPLTLAYVSKNTGDVFQGVWSVIPDPAPFPSNDPLEGASNYVFLRSNQCALVNDLVVTIAITEDLEAANGYSFQLNANTPIAAKNYSRCNWQQCGFQVDGLGNLSSWVNNWTPQGFASETPTGQPNPYDLHKWSTPTIPANSLLKISLQYNTDQSVTEAKFELTLPNGETKSNHIQYDKVLLSPYPKAGEAPSDYLAPICAVQLVIVGFDNKETANFTKGAGTITFSAANPLIPGDTRPACSGLTSTAENSNLLYGALSATPSTTLTQAFTV
jgi:hypothetical protein